MNTYEYKEAVEKALGHDNFHEAFRLLRVMMPGDAWTMRTELEAIELDYRRLLDYALSGSPDPSRASQLSALKTRIYGILDLLLRENLIPEHSSLYFNVVRTLRIRRGETLVSLIADYKKLTASLSAFAAGKSDTKARRLEAENLEERIFERVWTTTPLSVDELADIKELIESPEIADCLKLTVIAALTMSLLQFFNERIFRLLLGFVADGSSVQVQLRATVGAVLVMARWPRRSNTEAVARIIESLREQGSWRRDVEQIVMQIIRTADVDKIAKTMREEIIPQMMKLRPDIEKHIREVGLDGDFDANPEWEEILGKSGLTDRLRKLSDMQMEGGDLFFTAFSMLKNYQFFNHISHWFLPFDPDRLEVAEALGHDTALGMMLAESPTMCAGDKYSFVLSLDRLPESNKQMVMRQISEAGLQMNEEFGTDLMPDDRRRNEVITRYIQDLFRFFRLFRRCGEFYNPFARLINPVAIPGLKADFEEPDKLRLLGEFYFKHGHYSEAVDIFATLGPDVDVLQKAGHALLKLGRYEDALAQLERAEMLKPDSVWTLRRLAQVNKQLGRYAKALEYYERIEVIEPDRPDIALSMGHCHLQLNQLHEALHCYYKAEMLDESSTKPLRPIAWCAFLNGDYETARTYYNRLMQQLTPTPADYLNMAHFELAGGNLRQALNFYKLYTSDADKLARALDEDRPVLANAGVDTSLLPLIVDNIRYDNDR